LAFFFAALFFFFFFAAFLAFLFFAMMTSIRVVETTHRAPPLRAQPIQSPLKTSGELNSFRVLLETRS
jgi:hypothetical protein